MKKWNDFFDEETSAQHDKNIMQAVQPALAKNLAQNTTSKESLFASLFKNWQFLAGGLTAASALGVSLYLASRSELSDRAEDNNFLAFQDLLPGDSDDTQLLVDAALDLDLLDNLDLLEQMEES